MKVIGRNAERKVIHSALVSSDPELVAVWGPHRVGKTCLVRYCRGVEDHFLEVTGQRDAARKRQIKHFVDALSKAFHPGISLDTPRTWDDAFTLLIKSIESIPADGKPITVFFDETPWLDGRRSGFLAALEYFWNATGSKNERLKVIVCGSAGSWIIRRIVRGKGGWHRRVTRQIRVLPFKRY